MSESDSAAISALLQEHIAAVNSTDVDLLLKGMTDDVVYIGEGAAPILGKAAMREFITPVYEQASINISMTSESVEFSGDQAVQWGSCHGTFKLGAADPIDVNLTFMFVYRRGAEGGWRLSYDISTPGPSAGGWKYGPGTKGELR